MQRWHPLGKSSHEKHHLPTRIVRAFPEGGGKDVEDFATLPTPIVHHWSPIAHVRGLLSDYPMPGWTLEPFRMQHLEQKLITGLLVQ